ncbi:MAG: phage tail protein, partial [Candidatus Cryosericum sp.]
MDTRSDLAKYASGCRRLENMIATIYGPVTRRPGTKKIATAKGSSVRLIDFIYNPSTAYVCEFGEKYIRFYGIVTLGGDRVLIKLGDGVTPLEVVTPYAAADLPALQYKQIGASMWLVHPTYAPRWLKLDDEGNFSLTVIPFEDGPFLVRNDLDVQHGTPNMTLQSSVYAQDDTGTLTIAGVDPSVFSFEAGHVGSLWQIVLPRITSNVKLTTSVVAISDELDNVKGTINLTTGGTWAGTLLIERNANGAGWQTYSTFVSTGSPAQNFTTSITENDDNMHYRLNFSVHGSGTLTANLYVSESDMTGIVRVEELISSQVAAITVLQALDSAAATTPTARWSEGSWSGVRGYPTAIGFIQARVVYGGTAHQPTTVWFSATDDFENFAVGTQDDQAFEEQLTTANQIQWIAALQTLAIGTSGDEWVISTNSLNNPFTPTTVQGVEQATYGSAPLQPLKAHKSVLFLDSVR